MPETTPASFNLMDQNKPVENILVPVADEDDKGLLPEDFATEAKVPLWKQKDVRIWLIVLGVAILIFGVVFFSLSKQTSLFKGSVGDTTAEGDQVIFNDFNGTAAGQGGTTTTTTTTASTPDTELPSGDLGIVTGATTTTTTTTASTLDELIGTSPTTPIEPTPDFNFGTPTDSGIVTSTFEPSTDLSLISNTLPAAVTAPTVQGNTGPGMFVAFIPSLLYTILRKKK